MNETQQIYYQIQNFRFRNSFNNILATDVIYYRSHIGYLKTDISIRQGDLGFEAVDRPLLYSLTNPNFVSNSDIRAGKIQLGRTQIPEIPFIPNPDPIPGLGDPNQMFIQHQSFFAD